MTNEVIERLLEHQKELSSDVSSESEIESLCRDGELKLNILSWEHLACDASHSADQIIKMIVLGIYRPDYVAHRIKSFLRYTANKGNVVRDASLLGTKLLSRHFAEHGNLRKTRPDIIMKIRRNPGANSLYLD